MEGGIPLGGERGAGTQNAEPYMWERCQDLTVIHRDLYADYMGTIQGLYRDIGSKLLGPYVQGIDGDYIGIRDSTGVI